MQIIKTIRKIILLNLLTISLRAAPYIISWEIPTDSDIAGFKLDLQTNIGFSSLSDIRFCNFYVLNLFPNRTYYVAIIPYDKKGNLYEKSNWIKITTRPEKPGKSTKTNNKLKIRIKGNHVGNK